MENYNFKRSNHISTLKRKNIKLGKQVENYMIANLKILNETEMQHLETLKKNVFGCASNSLYKISDVNTYVGSQTCKSKCCQICNYVRQKRLRRKYLKFFQENEYLIEASKNGKTKTFTENYFNRDIRKTKDWIETGRVKYDLMHLTLTLPHYKDSGFRGEKFYYQIIISLFNQLRKAKFWAKYVYGGEYGVETTNGKYFYILADVESGEIFEIPEKDLKNFDRQKFEVIEVKEDEKRSNGLNIHIHALLFVRIDKQNRNNLHREILTEWNNLTVNEFNKEGNFITDFNSKLSTRKQLTKKRFTFRDLFKQIRIIENELNVNLDFYFFRLRERIEKIMIGGNIGIKRALNLNAKGATLIGLETIFSLQNGVKVRSFEFRSDAMLKAVLETISYHFEPQAFDKKHNDFDIDLLRQILPAIYRQPLRRRFGCLEHENGLDMNETDNSITEDYTDAKDLLEDDQPEETKALYHTCKQSIS